MYGLCISGEMVCNLEGVSNGKCIIEWMVLGNVFRKGIIYYVPACTLIYKKSANSLTYIFENLL